MEEKELKIQQLQKANEELLRQRDDAYAKIEQLEAQLQAYAASSAPGASPPARGDGAMVDPEEEICQLRAIVEAQEAALGEQREIIDSQSTLLSDLGAHLQATGAMADVGGASSRSCTPSRGMPPHPEAGPTRAPHAVDHGDSAPAASRGPHTRSGAQLAAARPGPLPGRSGGPPPMLQRSPREHQQQMLAQKRAGRVIAGADGHGSQRPRAELPQPRPNSAFGPHANAGVARSRSLTHDREERGSTGASSADSNRGTHVQACGRTTPSTPGAIKKTSGGSGGMLPPSLPLLRQEACVG